MIEVTIANIEEISKDTYKDFFSILPQKMQEEVSKYRLEKDRQRTLAGKMLLLSYLEKNTLFNLSHIEKTHYHKPYIKGSDITFNISHSGKYVVCAFSLSNTIGIDIEQISLQVNLDDFKEVLLENELNKIQSSKKPFQEFYTVWTIKEALLKAEGKGLIDDIKEVIIKGNEVFFKNKKYFISSHTFEDYVLSLVYRKEDEIKFSRFLNQAKF